MKKPDLFRSTVARRLVVAHDWQCTFIRDRALSSLEALLACEQFGDLNSAELYLEAVMTDLELDDELAVVRVAH